MVGRVVQRLDELVVRLAGALEGLLAVEEELQLDEPVDLHELLTIRLEQRLGVITQSVSCVVRRLVRCCVVWRGDDDTKLTCGDSS